LLSRGGRLIGVHLPYHTHLRTGGGHVIGLAKRTSQESDWCPTCILKNVLRIYVIINMSVLSIKEAEVNLNVQV